MRWPDPRPIAQGPHVLVDAVLLTLGYQLCRDRFGQTVDLSQAKPQGEAIVEAALLLWGGRLHPFQSTIPLRMVHIRRQHPHPVFRRIAHDLRRGVKAHRLRVEQRTAKGGREMAFEPARHIDEVRKACRVAFGKAIFTKAANLVETALRELAVVAAVDHAFDHHVLQFVHHAAAAEGRHGLAQPVRFLGRELGRIERNLHGLLLEDRYAQRTFENARQFVRWAVMRTWCGYLHLLGPAPSFKIGMDHVALDRAGPNDSDLNHEIVEFARTQPWQHVHLRAAFDLEYAERIPLAQHGVSVGIFTRDGCQSESPAVMIVNQVEAFPDATQHSQRQNIDLEDAQCFDIVLVPFDETAVGHGTVAHRYRFGQRIFG